MEKVKNHQITKFADWTDTYTFDNCKLNRQEYGAFLIQYLVGERNGFVLNLDGAWGTGKTEFLRRMYSELKRMGHPTIYIDAWESDFSETPLQVVASELLKQLESFDLDHYDSNQSKKLKQSVGKILKCGALSLAGAASLAVKATTNIDISANVGMSLAQEFFKQDDDKFTDVLTNAYSEQIDAIQNLKNELEEFAEIFESNQNVNSLPIIVLIDELDRCRPSYAIKLLEVVKHFFSVKNFVFVMASDTTQLCHSIKAVYGQDFDAAQYLKRFFHRKAELPLPDLLYYLNAQEDARNFPTQYIDLYPKVHITNSSDANLSFSSWQSIIALLAQAYQLSIRDVDQLLHKIHACLRTADQKDLKERLNFAALVIGIIEYDQGYTAFSERTNFRCVYQPPQVTELYIDPAQDISIEKYIDLCMQSVTLFKNTSHSSADMFKDVQESIDLLSQDQISRILGVGSNHNYGDQLSTAFRPSNKIRARPSNWRSIPHTNKIFLWEDLQKLILLSGNIS